MGIYLNPDNKGFIESANSEIYVDKTMMIQEINKLIDTNQKYICITRPRRFGKSTTREMLTAYYSKGCDSKELFSKFNIAKIDDFEKYLNKYNVVYLNMLDLCCIVDNVEDLIKIVNKNLISELRDLYVFDDIVWSNIMNNTLSYVFDYIYSKTKETFIFIIDEWDAVIRLFENDVKNHKDYLLFLCSLLKDKSYVSLAYMTGILPIKQYNVESSLNMFHEFTMLNQFKFANYTGFTEDEVKYLCDKYDISFDEMRQWYDGYNVDDKSIYNPNSVVSAIMNNSFQNYWKRTGTFESLRMYITMNMNHLKDKVIHLIGGEKIEIYTDTFQNDLKTFDSADDVLTLLIHLGYLTYDSKTNMAWIPNSEIRNEFISAIRNNEYAYVFKAINQSNKLLQYTLSGENNIVAEIIDEVHTNNISLLQYNDENSLSCVITLAYYSAQDKYVFYRELQGGYGFADVVLVPRFGINNPALVIELKWNQSVNTAIKQIKNNKYVDSLKDYHGKVLLVGINYDKKTKKHECLIEGIVKD